MTETIDIGTPTPLMQESLFLFDLGLGVFLSDPETGTGIRRYSEFDPIEDRERLIDMCKEYPEANLQAVIDKDSGFIAMAVGVGDWKHKAVEAFSLMCEKHGSPDTLSYQLPDGTTYYIFKPGAEEFRPEAGSGIVLMTGPGESLPAYPSLVDGQQAKKLGRESVLNISDWLAGNSATGESTVEGADPVPVSNVPAVELPMSPEDEEPEPLAPAEVQTENVPEGLGRLEAVLTEIMAKETDKSTILETALEWIKTQSLPIAVGEVASMVERLVALRTVKVQGLSGKELLTKLAEEITLFNDEQGRPYFFYEGEVYSAPSEHVKNRLKYHYLKITGGLPLNKDLNDVLSIAEAMARFEGPRKKLMNRVAGSAGSIVYDLRDKRFVTVTAEGWKMRPSFPLFRRYQHLQPQVEPIAGGDPWQIFDFLTVPEESQLLMMVYIISLFVPNIAHPVLAVCGDQGSAKSFLCTLINRLVDPTLTEQIIQPKNERDLIQTLRQKYVTVLDNLSVINGRVSDIFCQVCTGASISLRQLYTDEGENIAQFRHVVILNSINLAIVNADLMDRSIILKLRRIDPLDRKPEHELWAEFERVRSGILGGIFDTIATAMAIYPTVQVEHLPRLADFAKWGFAIAEALGRRGEQFIEDFSQNVRRQNESVVEKNVLCQSILTLMSERSLYLAKVGELHAALKNIAKDDSKDATFPKLPHHLRTDLERLRPSLLEHGISYEFLERSADGVPILFTKADTGGSLSPVEPVAVATTRASDEPPEAHSRKPIIVFEGVPEVAGA